MKVFLTGATGVIGRRLVPLLIKAGHHVAGVARTQKSWKTLGQTENQARRFTDAGGAGVVLRFGLFYGADSGHTLDMVRFVKKGIASGFGSPDGYISSVKMLAGSRRRRDRLSGVPTLVLSEPLGLELS